MPAIIVPQADLVFERGDKIYLTTKVQAFTPTPGQIEEFAFSRQLKSSAPNENLMWLRGQYVEADQPNLNGAQWRSGELAIKSLTPVLMPVTVMHDPRTAVGTIAEAKLMTPQQDQVARARIDTALALWQHRFPEVCEEAAINLSQGVLMQSMECFSPWYECADCSQVFYKQPHGAERANWCAHLKGEHQTQAARILGDVCFTGTGLIFGTRGAQGAYTEAHLADFQEEVAEYHQRVHTDTAKTARSHRMGVVQIEESELKILRDERDAARQQADTEKAARETAERKVEETEAAKATAEQERDQARQEKTTLEEQANQATLKDTRLGALGEGFKSKLGEFTRSRVDEQAKTLSDDEWENRLKELEEIAGVKRDATKEGGTTPPATPPASTDDPTFGREELARLGAGVGGGNGQPPASGAGQSASERRSVVGGLAGAFAKKPTTPAAK